MMAISPVAKIRFVLVVILGVLYCGVIANFKLRIFNLKFSMLLITAKGRVAMSRCRRGKRMDNSLSQNGIDQIIKPKSSVPLL
jgi:hypothetical protein